VPPALNHLTVSCGILVSFDCWFWLGATLLFRTLVAAVVGNFSLGPISAVFEAPISPDVIPITS
jgi:hypothetical protein